MKKNNLTSLLIVAILALLFLWLRENEMRVAAEAKMKNVQSNATSVINEKGEAIADLSTQVGEMQAQLQQTVDECRDTVAERDAQIVKMNEDARLATAEHENAIQEKDKSLATREAEIKENADKYDAALKKKNKELSEMGEELRKTTERLAAALKEKEQAESQTYDMKQSVASFERKLAKLTEDNRHLEALSQLCEQKASVASTADGPAPA